MSTALVIGGGSIGVRHARVLTELGSDVSFVSSRTDLPGSLFSSVSKACSVLTPDYVVIANETSNHQKAVEELIESDFAGLVLTEKPLAVSEETLNRSAFDFFGVAYNLRFHPVIEALHQLVAGQTPLSVEIYAGQDIRTWRPNRPVADQYSAHTSRGGGVLRDLSHELDYAQLLFGRFTGVFGIGGRIAGVTVDSDDSWAIVAGLEQASQASIQLNYLDQPGTRFIRVICQEATIHADVRAGTLTINGETTKFTVQPDDSYRAMHQDVLLNGGSRTTSAFEALETDLVIADIELSQKHKKWISR